MLEFLAGEPHCIRNSVSAAGPAAFPLRKRRFDGFPISRLIWIVPVFEIVGCPLVVRHRFKLFRHPYTLPLFT